MTKVAANQMEWEIAQILLKYPLSDIHRESLKNHILELLELPARTEEKSSQKSR